jgi:hypothetical protein
MSDVLHIPRCAHLSMCRTRKACQGARWGWWGWWGWESGKRFPRRGDDALVQGCTCASLMPCTYRAMPMCTGTGGNGIVAFRAATDHQPEILATGVSLRQHCCGEGAEGESRDAGSERGPQRHGWQEQWRQVQARRGRCALPCGPGALHGLRRAAAAPSARHARSSRSHTVCSVLSARYAVSRRVCWER